jgi:hypothetical protein
MRNRRASAPTFGKPVRLARSVPRAHLIVLLLSSLIKWLLQATLSFFYPIVLIELKKGIYQQESKFLATKFFVLPSTALKSQKPESIFK